MSVGGLYGNVCARKSFSDLIEKVEWLVVKSPDGVGGIAQGRASRDVEGLDDCNLERRLWIGK